MVTYIILLSYILASLHILMVVPRLIRCTSAGFICLNRCVKMQSGVLLQMLQTLISTCCTTSMNWMSKPRSCKAFPAWHLICLSLGRWTVGAIAEANFEFIGTVLARFCSHAILQAITVFHVLSWARVPEASAVDMRAIQYNALLSYTVLSGQ